MLDQALLHEMARTLDERFGLDTLWVFGSQATGPVTPASDVDLAALFRRRPTAVELLDTRESLNLLHPQGVDLVDLDAASPILAMQVLRYGRLLIDANPPRRLAFVAHLPGRYEDLKILRRPVELMIAERLRRGRS